MTIGNADSRDNASTPHLPGPSVSAPPGEAPETTMPEPAVKGASARPRLKAFDGLRIIGAVGVVTTHVGFASGASLSGPVAGLVSRLDAGVALFFVISGFLLFQPHAQAHLAGGKRPRTRHYLIKRAARILPPLWLTVVASMLLVPPEGGIDVREYLSHVTLVQIYGDAALYLPGLTQMWSLATEAAFYLALPAVAWLTCRGPRDSRWVRRTLVWQGGLVGVGALWMWMVYESLGSPRATAGTWLPGYVGWFGIGMAFATWHVARQAGILQGGGRLEQLAGSTGSVWAMAGALFVLLSTPVAGPYTLHAPTPGEAVAKNVGYAVLAGLLVLPMLSSAAREGVCLRVLGSRPFRVLGDISYGVFCYHLVVLDLLRRLNGWNTWQGHFWDMWLTTLAITLPLAWLSHRFMEKPLMAWVGRVSGRSVPRRRSSPAPPDHPNRTQAARPNSRGRTSGRWWVRTP